MAGAPAGTDHGRSRYAALSARTPSAPDVAARVAVTGCSGCWGFSRKEQGYLSPRQIATILRFDSHYGGIENFPETKRRLHPGTYRLDRS